MKRLLLAAIILFVYSACSDNSGQEVKKTVEKQQPESEPIEAIPIDSALTGFANFIAGKESDLFSFSDSSAQRKYSEFCKINREKYASIKRSRLDVIQRWNAANFKENSSDDSAYCFYPFAGGDFIHMYHLFPNASNYMMLAKEPVGTLPELTAQKSGRDLVYLNAVDRSLRNIYLQSYFITKNMAQDMRSDSSVVDGVLPFILWGLAKTDHEITEMNFFNIDTSGTRSAVDAEKTKRYTGVEIKFTKKGSNQLKTLQYLSVDISNAGFTAAPRVYTYLEKTTPTSFNSFVKSASYLLHYGSFTKIRDFVLARSNYHLQDDTGIPYKYFKQAMWSTQLFGKYTLPVSDFSPTLYQQDLSAAYKDSTTFRGDLKFSMVYHWGSREQNQMLFVRKRK